MKPLQTHCNGLDVLFKFVLVPAGRSQNLNKFFSFLPAKFMPELRNSFRKVGIIFNLNVLAQLPQVAFRFFRVHLANLILSDSARN